MNRIIATTVLGLVCWLINGIVHLVASYKRKSRKARKRWNVVAKILLVSVTLIVLLHSLAKILFLLIDVSDIPQRVNADADACSTDNKSISFIERYNSKEPSTYLSKGIRFILGRKPTRNGYSQELTLAKAEIFPNQILIILAIF